MSLYYPRNSDLYTNRSLIGITVAFKTARVISSRGKKTVALALVNILVNILSGTTYLYVGLPRIIVTIIVPSSSRNKSMKLQSRLLSKRDNILIPIILMTLIYSTGILPIIARIRLVRSRLFLRLSSNSLSRLNITSTKKRVP